VYTFHIPMTGSCEHSNEYLGFLKVKELISWPAEQISTFHRRPCTGKTFSYVSHPLNCYWGRKYFKSYWGWQTHTHTHIWTWWHHKAWKESRL